MNEIILVLKYKFLYLEILFAAGSIAGSFFHPIFVFPALLFTLGLFDQIGYCFVYQRFNPGTKSSASDNKLAESAYHIIGFIANLIALGLTWLLENHINGSAVAWNCISPFVIFFWFGGKDRLYYWGLQEEISDRMHWFYWTPLGIWRSLRLAFKMEIQVYSFADQKWIIQKRNVPGPLKFLWCIFLTHSEQIWLTKKEVNIQAIIGAILIAAYLIYFFLGVLI